MYAPLRDNLVCHKSKGKNVHPFIVLGLVAVKHLWSWEDTVFPHAHPLVDAIAGVGEPGELDVNLIVLAEGEDQEVGEAEVPVDDSICLQSVQGAGQLVDHLQANQMRQDYVFAPENVVQGGPASKGKHEAEWVRTEPQDVDHKWTLGVADVPEDFKLGPHGLQGREVRGGHPLLGGVAVNKWLHGYQAVVELALEDGLVGRRADAAGGVTDVEVHRAWRQKDVLTDALMDEVRNDPDNVYDLLRVLQALHANFLGSS